MPPGPSDGQGEVSFYADIPPPYTVHDVPAVQGQAQRLRHPERSPHVPASSPATAPERYTPGLRSVMGHVVVLHTANYVLISLENNAWRTRAIEYAIGTACFAFMVLLVKMLRLIDVPGPTEHELARRGGLGPLDAEAKRRIFITLTVVLSAGIPRMGNQLLSLHFGAQ